MKKLLTILGLSLLIAGATSCKKDEPTKSITPKITISSNAPTGTIPAEGETYTTEVDSNTPWTASYYDLDRTVTPNKGGVGKTKVTITVLPLEGVGEKEIKIVFTTDDIHKGHIPAIQIWQGIQKNNK